jgi:hypothetical protein
MFQFSQKKKKKKKKHILNPQYQIQTLSSLHLVATLFNALQVLQTLSRPRMNALISLSVCWLALIYTSHTLELNQQSDVVQLFAQALGELQKPPARNSSLIVQKESCIRRGDVCDVASPATRPMSPACETRSVARFRSPDNMPKKKIKTKQNKTRNSDISPNNVDVIAPLSGTISSLIGLLTGLASLWGYKRVLFWRH